jgi:hypothetical protein
MAEDVAEQLLLSSYLKTRMTKDSIRVISLMHMRWVFEVVQSCGS